MRTTVDLPQPLLESAKRIAVEQNATLSAVVGDALRGYLAHRRKRTGAPFRLYTIRGRLVQPDLDLDRTSALLADDDEAMFAKRR